jgi:hyperosmotically inducible protein
MAAAAVLALLAAGCSERELRASSEPPFRGPSAGQGVRRAARQASQTVKRVTPSTHKAAQPVQTLGRAAADAAITAEVKAALLADKTAPGMAIDVDTKNAVVTLTGRVATPAQAAKSIQIARKAKGVKKVVNHLRMAHNAKVKA